MYLKYLFKAHISDDDTFILIYRYNIPHLYVWRRRELDQPLHNIDLISFQKQYINFDYNFDYI